jgi:hypothetical protein
MSKDRLRDKGTQARFLVAHVLFAKRKEAAICGGALPAPARPNAPRPVAKSESVAGSGIADTTRPVWA